MLGDWILLTGEQMDIFVLKYKGGFKMKFKTKMKLLNIGNLIGAIVFLYCSFLAYRAQNYILLSICLIGSVVAFVCGIKLNNALNLIEENHSDKG